MRWSYLTAWQLVALTVGAVPLATAKAQASDSLPQSRGALATHVDSAGYDLVMGFHHGAPAGWSVALGAQRFRVDNFRHTTFLVVEPGSRGGRVSLGTGSDTGGDVVGIIATNIRASYLRIREPQGRTAAGNYGGVEVQLLVLGIGPRAGVFLSDFRHKPIATIDFSLAY